MSALYEALLGLVFYVNFEHPTLQGVPYMLATQGVALGYVLIALYSLMVVTVGSGRTF